ncbi:hypothetical protein L6164_007034 [Bauhinia variegata]|uniref:Uncharacterized protein n=1 Tax=Bauhinia variegata TaxID=167791 RepID=A0ACB9PWE3_BAUVA|nr:hypothetical protein L6164_007034 [Bauhinia variegata]
MPLRDVGSWNAMIYGFCQNGNAAEALDALNKMKMEGLKMDTITVSSILPVCAQSGDMITGMLIHLLWNAQKVFDDMKVRDLVSWNSIIAAYEQNNYPITALGYFKRDATHRNSI